MILQFPDPDAFRMAVTSGTVPLEILQQSVDVSFSPDGSLAVECEAKLPTKAKTELNRLGITTVKKHLGETKPFSCLLQLLPTIRTPQLQQIGNQQAVLLELESARDLPTILNEMLRLGNDRQGIRWIASKAPEKDQEERALIRAISPPFYTLLRAVDQTSSNTVGKINAYLEAAPRVWVQYGQSHPLAGQIQVNPEQILLLREDRDWEFLPDAPFRDVYEILKFDLPAKPTAWQEMPRDEKLTFALRLVAGNAADSAELWVLHGDAIQQLDAFVRDADERIVQRLKFAVARNTKNEELVVLRVTSTKLAPPILPLVGVVGYKPYYKLPNLYLPVGSRLHPTLRRDSVRKLLADNTDLLVWLEPNREGQFTPHTLSEDSFRPLENWVSYVVETNAEPLKAWLKASSFSFEQFICSDNAPKPPKDDKDSKSKRRNKDDDTPISPTQPRRRPAEEDDSDGATTTFAPEAVVVVQKTQSEWEVRRTELEAKFNAVEGELDHPDRVKLWPELAKANGGLGAVDEAVLCWANAFWESKQIPNDWVESWLSAESNTSAKSISAAEFDKRMKPVEPTVREFGLFAASLYSLLNSAEKPGWLASRLPAIQRYLEQHESKLSIRVAWLIGSKLATTGGVDTLGLARIRDRLLQRLFENGLSPEKDLPTFLRFAGIKDSDRVRQVRQKALELHGLVRQWAEASLKSPVSAGQSDQGATLGYIDLFFAFGLAKLGESVPSRQLIDSAGQQLLHYRSNEDRAIAANFLHKAFKYRIEQALSGKPHTGLLDQVLLTELEQIHGRANGQANNTHGMAHYVINRLREQCRILEPQEKLDPYAEWMRFGDELKRELSELPREKNPVTLAKRIRDLYRTGTNGKQTAEGRFHVLLESLPLSQRAGEALTFELIELVPETMEGSSAAGQQISELSTKQGRLLERAIGLAAHFDRREIVAKLVDQFIALLKNKPEDQRLELINVVASQCLRSLRKLGLKDDIDKMLRRLRDLVLGGLTMAQMRQKVRGKGDAKPLAGKPDPWAKSLQSLLHIAGGWLTFGLSDQANPILDDARQELLTTHLPAKDYTALAQAYVTAVGHGPADSGLTRIVELYQHMDPARITNSFTTCKFYSRFHLNLVEETVLAVVSDDFALGAAGRRWLDEDEQLVRRRIHRDMRELLKTTGL
jgi:cellulose synthase operon protein C